MLAEKGLAPRDLRYFKTASARFRPEDFRSAVILARADEVTE